MVVTFHQAEISELEAVKKIKGGEPLSSFAVCSDIMALAAMTADKDRWIEVPISAYTPRVARKAVLCNFHALERVPEEAKNRCTREFATHLLRMKRDQLPEYTKIFSAQNEAFIKKTLRESPQSYSALDERQKEYFAKIKDTPKVARTSGTRLPERDTSAYQIVTDSEAVMLTPEVFIGMRKDDMTKEKLDALLQMDILFPRNFISKLLTPNRNAAYYTQKEMPEQAAFWENQKLPWLNKDVIRSIVKTHPEASIDTPQYLDKDSVSAFFRRWELSLAPDDITRYFLAFPESVLTAEDASFITTNTQVLAHAPSILADSDLADKYLSKNPGEVLHLPAAYQTRNRILTDGVHLRKENMPYIQDKELRTLLTEALTAPEQKHEHSHQKNDMQPGHPSERRTTNSKRPIKTRPLKKKEPDKPAVIVVVGRTDASRTSSVNTTDHTTDTTRKNL